MFYDDDVMRCRRFFLHLIRGELFTPSVARDEKSID